MPLKQMAVASQLPGAPALPLGNFIPVDVDAGQIQIRNIEGLGPVKAELATAPFALARGVFFQGSSVGQRNIVLTLGLNPTVDQSLAALRALTYRYFMPELVVTLTFSSDEREDVHIDCVVESVEPNIFSQDPEMQISLICPRPDFIGNTENTIGPWDTMCGGSGTTEIEYTGSVSNGFELDVTDEFSYYNGDIEVVNDNGPFHFDLKVNALTISPHQSFKLKTVPTNRRVQYINVDTGLVSSIMGKMWKGSSWPELMPGTNELSIFSDYTGPQWTLTYYNRYGGL